MPPATARACLSVVTSTDGPRRSLLAIHSTCVYVYVRTKRGEKVHSTRGFGGAREKGKKEVEWDPVSIHIRTYVQVKKDESWWKRSVKSFPPLHGGFVLL